MHLDVVFTPRRNAYYGRIWRTGSEVEKFQRDQTIQANECPTPLHSKGLLQVILRHCSQIEK